MSKKTATSQWSENSANLLKGIRTGLVEGFTEVAGELTSTKHQRGAVDQKDIETQGDYLGNWHAVEDPSQAPSFVEGLYRDASGASTLNRAEQKIKNLAETKKNTLTFYFINVAPYAIKLEYGGYAKNTSSTLTTPDGYSTQAPQGMVRKYNTQDRNTLVSQIQHSVNNAVKNAKVKR